MNNPIGLYIHVPFCASKCAYCDFYSFAADEKTYEAYKAVLCRHLTEAGARLSVCANTLYFGGGTPTLLGGKRISEITETAKKAFGSKFAEITVEANPAEHLFEDLKAMADAGVDRLSIGMQSCIDNELKALSRRHTADDVKRTVSDAKTAGITNISVDVMLGIPHQTTETLKRSLDFCLDLGITHISCYMLKIEPDTPFGKTDVTRLDLPDEDTVADMYIFISDYLELHGFEHYEISNFALPGYRAKHNMKYWQMKEYLGLGPAAHSFINGKRFYFERDLNRYIRNATPKFDTNGGDSDEYIMLKLRLSDGIDYKEYQKFFGKPLNQAALDKAKLYEKSGLVRFNEGGFSLTKQGFLVSNTVISEILEVL